MGVRPALLLLGCGVVLWSCTGAPANPSPSPAPGPGVPSAPATTPAAGQRGAPPAGGPARRVPPSRDSLAKLRAVYVDQVMKSIAGRENQPAEQVFKNVQVLKGITAEQLVHKMNDEYAVAMSWNCTNCHRLAPQGNFASDTSADKKRARFMQQMQNDINQVQLPKLYPKDTPKVECATCHRGYNEPLPPSFLIPERGKPGGPPMPAGRGGPPPGR